MDRRRVAAQAGTWRAARCAGLSLVELLVALAIGVALSFAAVNVLLHSKQSYFAAEELARIQDNGRYALRYLSHELAMAGYLATELPATDIKTKLHGSSCFDHLLVTTVALEHLDDVSRAGLAAGGTATLPADCLLPGKHVPTSDVLLTRRAASAPAAGAVDSSAIYLWITPTHEQPQTQRGGDGVTSANDLWEYRPQVLFLRDYSVVAGDGTPALCRKRLGRSSNRMAPTQCLLEGVENMQIEFGIDDDGDRRADRFEPAPDAEDLRRAVAARIYLLLRSLNPIAGHIDDRAYALGATFVAPAMDRYYRRLMQTTVLLRNPAGLKL